MKRPKRKKRIVVQDSGTNVRQIQQILWDLGAFKGIESNYRRAVDGLRGPKTNLAIKNLASKNGYNFTDSQIHNITTDQIINIAKSRGAVINTPKQNNQSKPNQNKSTQKSPIKQKSDLWKLPTTNQIIEKAKSRSTVPVRQEESSVGYPQIPLSLVDAYQGKPYEGDTQAQRDWYKNSFNKEGDGKYYSPEVLTNSIIKMSKNERKTAISKMSPQAIYTWINTDYFKEAFAHLPRKDKEELINLANEKLKNYKGIQIPERDATIVNWYKEYEPHSPFTTYDKRTHTLTAYRDYKTPVYQTVTASGKNQNIDADFNETADYSDLPNSTGAGIYKVDIKNTSTYMPQEPLFNLITDNYSPFKEQMVTAFHTVPASSASYINGVGGSVSAGCLRGMCGETTAAYNNNYIPEGSYFYVHPYNSYNEIVNNNGTLEVSWGEQNPTTYESKSGKTFEYHKNNNKKTAKPLVFGKPIALN